MNEDKLKSVTEEDLIEESPTTSPPAGSAKEPVEGTEVVTPEPDLVDLNQLHEDDVIVFLEDDECIEDQQDVPLLLSVRPGEEPCSELEDLPEITAQLIDDLPDVENVEDITSLVEGSDPTYKDELLKVTHRVIDRAREVAERARELAEQARGLAIEHWKPGVIAASLLVAAVLVIFPWGRSGPVTDDPVTSAAVAEFENWVDDVIDQHQQGIGAKSR